MLMFRQSVWQASVAQRELLQGIIDLRCTGAKQLDNNNKLLVLCCAGDGCGGCKANFL